MGVFGVGCRKGPDAVVLGVNDCLAVAVPVYLDRVTGPPVGTLDQVVCPPGPLFGDVDTERSLALVHLEGLHETGYPQRVVRVEVADEDGIDVRGGVVPQQPLL